MIILSQDKVAIINFDNVERIIIGIEDTSEILCEFRDGETLLGKYESEERAMEVLEEITCAYSDFIYYKNAEEIKKARLGEQIVDRYGTLDVYKMPEK